MSASGAKRVDRDLGFTLGVSIAALLPRLYVAIAWAREPVWDAHYYDLYAKRIAAGLGYSEDVAGAWRPCSHYPVGYSGFLAIFYELFGHGAVVGPIANALAGALTVALVHRLARHATSSPTRARVAAILTALHPGLVVYSALLMTEPLAGLGMILAAWIVARDRSVRSFALAGVVLGLATLVRPTTLLALPALAFFLPEGLVDRAVKLRAAASRVTIATVVAFACVVPWTLRNCARMDGCALVSTNAGWNLAIGAFPRATGRFEGLKASDGCPIVTGQVQQDRCWLGEGVKWIREDPARWLRLVPKKLGFTFDHESFPIGYLGEASPAAWPEERRAAGRDLLSNAHRLLLFAAALGVIARPRRDALRIARSIVPIVVQGALAGLAFALALSGATSDTHAFWPLAVAIPLAALAPWPGAPKNGGVVGYLAFAVLGVCVTHAVFFGEDRYHMVLSPALAILAACALRPIEDHARAA